MYVCICGAVDEKELKEAVKAGFTTYQAVLDLLPVAQGCGKCTEMIQKLINEENDNEQR